MITDRLSRGLAADGAVRVLFVDATRIAQKTAEAHGLGPAAAHVAAEAVVATALMSAHMKGDERVTLQVQSEEPALAFIGEIDGEGHVRARLTPPDARGGALRGVLFAIKSDGTREVYRGGTEIRDQHIAEALSAHLGQSSQVDVQLRIAVLHADTGEVRVACGLLVERLPFAAGQPSLTTEEFRARYDVLAQLDDPAVWSAVLEARLGEEGIDLLIDRDLTWQCRCSLAKVEGTLVAMGADEIRALQAEGQAEVTCHFCNHTFRLDVPALDALLARTIEQEAARRD